MPSSKNYVKIKYPRKCNHCDYISNNPAMWHYHNKTHDLIPKDTLCWQGCGKLALFTNTSGKHTCAETIYHCPEYIKRQSIRTTKQWENADERKEKTKETFLKSCVNNESAREKQLTTLNEKWGGFTPEESKEYRRYARRIRQRAQRWAKKEGYKLGTQTYHVDHKLSIWDAWGLGLSEFIVNHPANLQIIDAKQNSGKGATSILTYEQLMEAITAYA